MGRLLLFLSAIVVAVSICCGQLSTEEKQRALDFHNELRRQQPAGDMRQLEWNVDLAERAQSYSQRCYLRPNPAVSFQLEPGRTITAGETLFAATDNTVIEDVIMEWYEDPTSFVQLVWAETYLLGCGMTVCPILALPDGQGRTSGTLFVCNYAPSNYSDRLPYTTTDDLDGTGCACPAGLECHRRLCAETAEDPIVPDDDGGDGTPVDRRVYYFTPRSGSVAGGTQVTIHGIGFSADQVNGGNEVVFTATNGNSPPLPCDVISYYSSTSQIICVTRAPPSPETTSYRVTVRAHEGGGLQEVTCSSCTFVYRTNYWTPQFEGLDPLSSVAGFDQRITMSGRFFTAELQNQEDTDDEFFTRILVGGVPCDFVDENGIAYGAALNSETSTRGYVICRPTYGDRIDSMNVTGVLANRGNTHTDFINNVLALDNRFRPYNFQTHAVIEGVYPDIGSVEGGTRISVTLNVAVANYSVNDIQVFVGGVPCEDIELVPPYSVECTTGPAPAQTLYYPCGRGLLREVWIGDSLDLDNVEQRPRSENNSPQERAFRSNGDVREFNERNVFTQRYSGFFVPPVTSLYTFQVQSDDLSRLYLSPNASEEHKQIIAYAPQHTRSRRDFFPSQTSEPVFLEAGSYYYIEALLNQFYGPWYLGFGAKVHSLDWTAYPYQGDKEAQRISITSTVVKEQHEIQLGALPCVWKVTVTSTQADDDQEPLSIPEFCLDIGDETLSFMSDAMARDIEEAINSLANVQRMGYVQVLNDDSYLLVFLSRFEVSRSELPDVSIGTNSDVCSETTMNVTIEKIQELTFPDSFNLVFSDARRSTEHLPINVTSETIQESLTDLLGWECQDLLSLSPEQVFVSESFEDDTDSDRDNSTSFCGRYSLKNPDTIWTEEDTGEFSVTEYRYVCLAHAGSLPALLAEFYYFRQAGARFISETEVVDLNLAACAEILYQDSGWLHVCFDLEQCILPNTAFDGTLHTVTSISLGGGGTYWIDEFLIAKSKPSTMRSAAPAQPGGVRISYLEVSGGMLELPRLLDNSRRDNDNVQTNETGSDSSSSQNPYVMIFATHTVTYTTDNCGHGISLLEGNYEGQLENEMIRVDITRVASGSLPVGGTFEVSIGGVTVRNIDADVSSSDLEFFLEANFPEEEGFSVTRSGDCTGYQWEVYWENRGGDLPLMGVNGEGLTGTEPMIAAERLIDGGVWLWPFRGDMLRHPSTDPQVEVIINDIPSSCPNCDCTFIFSSESTPTVNSIYPFDGQGGTSVTISGGNFTDDTSSVTVTLGEAYCHVMYANETHILCIASSHPAGWYDVNVHINGVGFAYVEESVCFRYKVIVDSITPNSAGIGGGQTVTIKGNGFLDFVRYGVEDIDEDFQNNPWFEAGLGLPDLGRLQEFLCDYYLYDRLESLSLQEFDIEHIFDFADSSDDDISMRYDETEFERLFGFLNATVDPDFEVVDSTGSFSIRKVHNILYYLYISFPSFVLIGDVPCIIVSANLTTIECTTPIHLPGLVNVSVFVFSESDTLENAFEYSVSESALIDSINPECGPVSGGTTLQIRGSNYLNEDSTRYDIRVYIGEGGCEVVFANTSYIECVTDSNRPGFEPVLVSTPNGVAIWESALNDEIYGELSHSGSAEGINAEDLPPFPVFRYQLVVNSIEPTAGSLLGGNILRITGAKFVEGDTTVYIGNEYAEIQSITRTSIECIIPSSRQVHYIPFINNTRFDPVLGYMFSWNVSDTLYIEVGDTVQWDWVLEIPGSGLSVNVFQTPDRVISTRLPGGFESETTTTGSFSYTFSQTGEYHYASVLTQNLVLRGSIVVQELQSSSTSVRVFSSGYEAEYDILSSSGSTGSDPSSGENKRSIPETPDTAEDDLESSICADLAQSPDLVPSPPYDGSSPMYNYRVCSTPRIYDVYPTEGTLETTFTISGIGFSSNTCDNIVQMGGYECTVTHSNITTIECQLNPSRYPPSFTELPLSVNIRTLGDAYIASPDMLSVSIRPIIVDVSPSIGSIEGETRITISGQAFTESYTEVLIGDAPCSVLAHNYTDIMCITAAVDVANEFEVTVLYMESTQYAVCVNPSGCTFEFSEDATPVVEAVSPTNIQGPGTTDLTINGTGFSSVPSVNEVFVGEYPCIPFESSNDYILCTIGAIPAGEHELSLTVCSSDSYDTPGNCVGRARIQVSPIVSTANIASISPSTGSILGGTVMIIEGIGFTPDRSAVSITIGGSICRVINATYTTLFCETSSNSPGSYSVLVISHGMSFPETVQFAYDQSTTPVVTGVFPSLGQQGGMVTVTGSNLGSLSEETSVMVGQSPCEIDAANSNSTAIQCMLGPGVVGFHPVQITNAMGNAMGEIEFFYTLQLEQFSPTESSLAGLNPLTLTAHGFNPSEVSITVCNRPCELSLAPTTIASVQCIVPPMTDVEVASDGFIECNVTVESLGESETFVGTYIYRENLTPVVDSINRTRGGTQGGSRILILGSGFTDSETASVSIADVECAVISQDDTSIVCETGASGRTVRAQVLVYIPNKGFARSEGIEFFYIDLWSSRFTWGGDEPPRPDDFVVIPRGQTILLDTTTNILAYLLVQGGELIFDDEQEDDVVQLHTQGMLITDGGRLQVGTEAEPFLHKTKIILYGNVLSTEIPVYGAKTLALREGSIDLHGKPLDVTWTKLSQTAGAGAVMLHLKDAVDWEVGGRIVIASTSFSQRENEEKEIAAIDETRRILTITTPLEHDHIAIMQTIEGRDIDTSAEVGYLTRNVLVRGNLNEEWEVNVTNCPEEFRTGQFEIQTCFFGRFGAETIGDQFGSQIMIHAAEQNQGDVFGRFSYIEVTHAGQAFRLGRYPIHFHLNGDVSGSYVRGCAIHHTFNRAVTVHAVNHLLIEKNVAYNILGHAYFLEDGIEEHNIMQDNLGIFVRASSSLLNVDITPATFWIVNPNNIIRRNAAAGGTHFGFWYRLPQNPTGPSQTSSVCPRHLPVEEFSDNTAHSFGWYGLWVFPNYYPRAGGGCNDMEHSPVVFNNFLSWRNDRGVEFSDVGSLQLNNSIMLDNNLAGVEYTDLNAVWGENGPLIQNTLIVGHSDITAADPSFCTNAGVRTPHSYFLTVSDVTFVNFDRSCFVIQACSHCRAMQGGFETRYRRINLVNSPNLTQWQWQHEHVHRDMDGTLTGSGPSLLTPTSGILPPQCRPHPQSSSGVDGSICDESLKLGRFALFDPVPSSLEFTTLFLSNDYGTVELEYVLKRLLGTGAGYMGILPLNKTYSINSTEDNRFTNISYTTRLTGFLSDDYITIHELFPRSLDFVSVNGNTEELANATVLDPDTSMTGDWVSGDNNSISYFIRGSSDEDGTPEVFDVTFSSFRCFYDDCIPPPPPTIAPPPPPGRPDDFLLWSDTTIWPDGRLPMAGENVFINCSLYIVVDIEIPRLAELTICGSLELGDTLDHVIEVDLIFIRGGRLVAGYPDTPFVVHNVTFILHGNLSSTELFLENGPNVGAKAIAAFGELILHGRPRTPTWTRLAEKAMPGDFQITVVESVDWQPGESIVITSTSFEAEQTEVFEIEEVSQNVITLKTAIMYEHSAEKGDDYSLQAEVGLLTRNIVIENGNPDLADEEAFGCRVLVSTYINLTESAQYVGLAQIRGVEFRRCGQLGHTESFDPRFALAFLGIDQNGESSYVNDSSFHDGYNTGIGVFRTNGIRLHNNVIHSTVGTSVHVSGPRHSVTNNLASLAIFLGTYRDRNEPLNSVWTANFELTDAEDLKLTGNVASGGARAGFHTNGEECSEITANAEPMITGNVAHSTLHGVHMGYFPEADGYASGCSRLHGFTIHSCFHYGIFSYSQSGLWITEAALINNKAGVYVTVIRPAALTHVVGDKEVIIENSLIVSASADFTCAQDSVVPVITSHSRSFSGLTSQDGGHAGILLPSFVSGNGHFPKSPWFSIISYPAINGLTTIRNVRFVNFNSRCEKTDVALVTNMRSEDANHPVYMRDIQLDNVSPSSKFFNHEPNLGSVNPSDCVDMDCDGLKHVLIKDFDGSFTETSTLTTIVSMAEFQWLELGGDRRRGIGDLRIPRTMLAYPNGSRIPIDDIYPKKGIARGHDFGDESQCNFNTMWQAYQCMGIDHLMLVIESLDADTETRRLSPIGIGSSSGFIDLLNGPMDNGWCGGYTCQERISTFYGIVAAGLEYIIGLTSTNPQNMALHLLHPDNSQKIVVGVVNTNPQRLDVYINDEYIVPNNAERNSQTGNLVYMERDPSIPDQFRPTLADTAGSNYYDRDFKRLYITLDGSRLTIVTTPVIQVSLTLAVTADDFFNSDMLVQNIAFLLGIDMSRIRIVNVVRETARRKRQTGETDTTIEFEIGEPPVDTLPQVTTPETGTNETTTEPPPESQNNATLTFEQLEVLTEDLVEAIQTGELTQQLNVSVVSATVEEPEPPPEDPTGGVRATPDTGGLQPEDVPENSTILTFSEIQMMMDLLAQNESSPVVYSIPTRLVILQQQGRGFEGRVFTEPLMAAMYDNNGEIVHNLGFGTPWTLTASILSGPEGASLTDASSDFVNGIADFSNLTVSLPGSYVLLFTVTYPPDVDFRITADQFTVAQRLLELSVSVQPGEGNTSRSLYPYPTVQLIDSDNGELVTNHGWRNRTWIVSATVQAGDSEYIWMAPLSNGEAQFTNILIPEAGTYQIEFTVFTQPNTENLARPATSESFEIINRPVTKIDIVYDSDFDSIVGNSSDDFIETFTAILIDTYDSQFEVEFFEIVVNPGSIIVSFFAIARSAEELVAFIDLVTSDNATFTFIFNGQQLVPSSIEQDPAYPVLLPAETENKLVLILATAIPSGTILVTAILLIVVITLCHRHKKKTKVFKIKVKPLTGPQNEERYVTRLSDHFVNEHADSEGTDEFRLYPDRKLNSLEARSSESHELKSLDSGTYGSSSKEDEPEIVVAKEVKVEGGTVITNTSATFGQGYSNPTAVATVGNLDMESSLEEIWSHSANSNGNSNKDTTISIEAAVYQPPSAVADEEKMIRQSCTEPDGEYHV